MSGLSFDPAWKPPPRSRATIILIHGAIVEGYEMWPLRRRLTRLGYHVRQFYYRSMLRGLDDNVRRLRAFIRKTEGDPLHVIGHSMGGILMRQAFEYEPDSRPGRLIAIGSPFLDCWVAHRYLGLHAFGRYLLGKTVHDHIRHPRDPIWRGQRELGVIAGTYPFGIGRVFRDLPSPSDGIILWRETQLQGITAQVTFPINHFGMLLSRRCCVEMARFLATGTFRDGELPPDRMIPVLNVK
jgi:pimeloyl-ACP methyl ester carboxylesterase